MVGKSLTADWVTLRNLGVKTLFFKKDGFITWLKQLILDSQRVHHWYGLALCLRMHFFVDVIFTLGGCDFESTVRGFRDRHHGLICLGGR